MPPPSAPSESPNPPPNPPPPSRVTPTLKILSIPPPPREVTSALLTLFKTSPSASAALAQVNSHWDLATRPFATALSIRAAVFVDEQACPWDDEIDADDARAQHMLACDAKTGNAVATARIVPGPHAAHPWPGSVDGVGGAEHEGAARGRAEGTADVRTGLHDGVEAYVKMGRVAVVKEMRGLGVGRKVMEAAMAWAEENAGVLEVEGRRWEGLMMVHAQKHMEGMYQRMGFETDPELGEWWEVGIPHIAMWKRLKISDSTIGSK